MLCAADDVLAWIALVCTSFSSMNVGTSRRSPTTPWGKTDLPHVQEGNLMASRAILLIYLVTCLRGKWFLEQPGSSMLQWLPRFEDLVLNLKMWQVYWWARHYGALTPILGLPAFGIKGLKYKRTLQKCHILMCYFWSVLFKLSCWFQE